MGIYIEGMEMPHDCDECRLCAFIPVGDYGIHRKCLPLNANAEITIRRTDCPLIPVPEHGRLIEADAFDARIRLAGGMCEEELTEDFKDGVQTTLYMLKSQPTVIPAEPGEEET